MPPSISRTNFCFPRRFEKSGLYCNWFRIYSHPITPFHDSALKVKNFVLMTLEEAINDDPVPGNRWVLVWLREVWPNLNSWTRYTYSQSVYATQFLGPERGKRHSNANAKPRVIAFFSQLLDNIMYWYCEEKFDLDPWWNNKRIEAEAKKAGRRVIQIPISGNPGLTTEDMGRHGD